MWERLQKGCKEMWRQERGAVTIYLVIVFLVMIVLIGLLVDLARIKVAQNQLRRVTNSAARSVLADYDPGLKKSFGLFTYKATDATRCEPELARYVRANLTPSAGQDFRLLDYRVEKVQARLINPLQPVTLKQQILEDMKYTAPMEYTKLVTKVFSVLPRMSTFYQRSRANNQLISDSRTKLKEAPGLQTRVNEKGKDLANKQEELTQARQASQEATTPEDKAALQREIAEIQQQISTLKQEVATELKRCLQITEETQANQKQLRATGDYGDPIDPATDQRVEATIQGTEKILDQRVNQVRDQMGKSTNAFRKDVDASIQALATGDYQSIQLATLDVPAVETQAANDEQMLRGEFNNLRDQVMAGGLFEDPNFLNPFAFDSDPDQFEQKHGQDLKRITQQLQELESTKSGLENLRDELYINEYALVHLSNITAPKGREGDKFYRSEAEYIAVGGSTPRVTVFTKLYLMRTSLDTIAYYCFSKVPVDPVSRGIYSVVMGALHGAVDCFRLALGYEVAIAEMHDPVAGNANPLQEITVSYKDHLRLLLATNPDEEGKLQRIIEVIQVRQNTSATNYHTMITGQVEVSIPLWFIPLGGVEQLDWGPFGTRIKSGRCYITKEVEYGY